jgi:uncharacterized protein YndB with AHSA1/START domain
VTSTTQQDSPTDAESAAVHVARAVAAPPERVWQCLSSADGARALLGDGARLGAKGEPWRSADGTHGVLRSYHPLEQVRVSWHAEEDDPASIVDLRLAPDDGGDGTVLDLRHEHLPAGVDVDGLRTRWESALGRLAEAAGG